MSLAFDKMLVLGIVSQPAEEGLTGIMAHTSVGQAHCQSQEGYKVVWVELQTPGWRHDSFTGEEKSSKVFTSKRNLDLTSINWDRPKQRNIRPRLMISGPERMSSTSPAPSLLQSRVCMLPTADDLN